MTTKMMTDVISLSLSSVFVDGAGISISIDKLLFSWFVLYFPVSMMCIYISENRIFFSQAYEINYKLGGKIQWAKEQTSRRF